LIPIAAMTESEKQEFYLMLEAEVASLIPPGLTGPARFALLVFEDDGTPRYVGNANPADVARAFREAADRIDREGTTFGFGHNPSPSPPDQTPPPRPPDA
jgi:hypothetical protein